MFESVWYGSEPVSIPKQFQMEDALRVVRYLKAYPGERLLDQLQRLPARISRLWGESALETLRLRLLAEPSDNGPERLIVEFKGSGDPHRDAELLRQLDAERAEEGELTDHCIIVLTV